MDEELKRHLEEVGYVDFGYISPELSSNEEYPEYIRDNVAECIEKIQAHQNRTSITFGLWADVHFSPSFNHNIRMKRAVNAYREIADKVHCGYLVLNGDHCNDGIKDYKVNSYMELRKFIKEFNYLPVNGNHDANSIWDQILEHSVASNVLYPDDLYTLFYNHLPLLGAYFDKENKGLYYYLDDNNQNVRYIVIDTGDVPDSFKNNTQHIMCISQKQLDWLINEALNVDENTDIVIFTHDAVFPSTVPNKEQKNLLMINMILDAYKNREKIVRETGENEFKIKADKDFSQCKGNIIALFSGHYHEDILEYSESGIPFIYTANFMMYPAREHTPRVDGNKTELLFDIVTINRDEKTVYLTRIGSGNDVKAIYKHTRVELRMP